MNFRGISSALKIVAAYVALATLSHADFQFLSSPRGGLYVYE